MVGCLGVSVCYEGLKGDGGGGEQVAAGWLSSPHSSRSKQQLQECGGLGRVKPDSALSRAHTSQHSRPKGSFGCRAAGGGQSQLEVVSVHFIIHQPTPLPLVQNGDNNTLTHHLCLRIHLPTHTPTG